MGEGRGWAHDVTAPPRQLQQIPMGHAEPVFYHSMPAKFSEEILHSLCVTGGTIDLAAGDGKLAYAHICHGKPYFGIALSQNHLDTLKQRLINMVLVGFVTEGSGIYQPAMALKQKQAADAAKRLADEQAPPPRDSVHCKCE